MRKLTMPELNRLSLTEYQEVEKLDVIIVLDNVRSLSNIGSFFRTADAFRIGEIFLCGITACPPHREIHKTALGAEDSVRWRYFDTTEDACKYLKENNYVINAVEQIENSVMLNDYVPVERSAYIFGNEVDGVDDEVLPYCDSAIEIPQEGTKHSLNVSVSAGIVMYHLFNSLWKK
ncbi:MAG: RNA methyltransferase [Bacteroidales bacterium]|nr:RNA methyltransferase [Bacteroidales bacterium]MBR3915471.1 RNA methyltransferase [Bacteroidales bacterium]